MPKCERCGRGEVRQEGLLLEEASGPDATRILGLRGKSSLVIARVCDDCASKMLTLGWKDAK